MNISFKKEEGLRINYTVPDEDATMEFTLAIARFALPGTWYNVDQWLKFLRDLSRQRSLFWFNKLETRLQQIRESGMPLTLNQDKITDSKAYELLPQGVVFTRDIIDRSSSSDTQRLKEMNYVRNNSTLH